MPALRYLLSCIGKHLAGGHARCPSCGVGKGVILSRKYLVTALVRCQGCALLYRVPTTSEAENRRFYQVEYQQGFTTDLPDNEALVRLTDTAFKDSGKDFSPFIAVLRAAGATGGRLFDYGCSWGYGSWQFARAGYAVSALEISRPRRDFARDRLNVQCCDRIPIESSQDVFFSSHVLEHVPSVAATVEAALGCLKPGGLFVAETPNGSEALRVRDPGQWDRYWGAVHPNFLDDVYWRRRFAGCPLYLGSPPYDLDSIARWRREGGCTIGDLSGLSLLAISRKPS